MSQVKPQINVLTQPQIAQLHDYSLGILNRVGVRVDSQPARKVFEGALGRLKEDGIVRIPAELVDWALKTAPASVDIYNRCGQPAFQLGGRTSFGTRFGVGVTNLYFQDPLTDELSRFTREHMGVSVRLANVLPSYDVVSTIGILQDYPPECADLYGTLEMVANTDKPLVILISEEKCFETCLDLLEALHGDFCARPWCIPYVNPITPLVMNAATCDKVMAAIGRGLPIIYNSVGMAGATAPITPAGLLALLNAELLAGLVFSQLVKEGAPIVLGILPMDFDMKHMEGYYTPRTLPLNTACAELMAHYGLPHSGSSGSGVGWGADLPGSGTIWMNYLTGCLSKVGLAPFVGGRFDSLAFCPAFVVYANDVIRYTRLFAEGFVLDDEAVALNEIEAIGPGGNFLAAEQTVALCRKTHFSSAIWPYLTLDQWQAAGRPRADDILRTFTHTLLAEHTAPDDHDEIIEKGEAYIRKMDVVKGRSSCTR